MKWRTALLILGLSIAAGLYARHVAHAAGTTLARAIVISGRTGAVHSVSLPAATGTTATQESVATVQSGAYVVPGLFTWIQKSFASGYVTRDVQLKSCGSRSMVTGTLSKAYLAEVGFPALVSGSSQTAYLNLRVRSSRAARSSSACDLGRSDPRAHVAFRRGAFSVSTTTSLPSDIGYRETSAITWTQTAPKRAAAGSSHISQVTFKCSGNRDTVKAAFDLFDGVASGGQLTGTIRVSLLAEQDFSALATLTLGGLSLVSFAPGGQSPDHPATLLFSFTVAPSTLSLAR